MGKYYDWFGMLTKSFASRALDSEFVGVRSREETKTAKVREQDTIEVIEWTVMADDKVLNNQHCVPGLYP